jgi:hypothetical protein
LSAARRAPPLELTLRPGTQNDFTTHFAGASVTDRHEATDSDPKSVRRRPCSVRPLRPSIILAFSRVLELRPVALVPEPEGGQCRDVG